MLAEPKMRVGEELERLSRALMREIDASPAREAEGDGGERVPPERQRLQERIRPGRYRARPARAARICRTVSADGASAGSGSARSARYSR